MDEDKIILKVAGREFTGWKSIQLDLGLDALVGSFSFAMSDRWPGAPDSWGVEAGDACEVYIGSEKVMTAWIDKATYSVDPDKHPITMAGMARTIDLTDCSAIHTPGSWKKRRMEQIAGDLTKPFNIAVKAIAPTGAVFPSFALQQGESVFEAIDRMARQRGLLPVTNADGDVELITPGKTPAGYTLELGRNIETISFENDLGDRFSDYVLKGYARDGKTRPKASAKDAGMGRYRPLLIVHDDDSTPGNLAARAKHEATIRAGRGQRIQVGVSGWRAADGQLYRYDRLAPVKAKAVGIDSDLLVSHISFRHDDSGRRSVLTLAPKEAYSLMAVPTPARRRRRSTPPPGSS